MGQMGSETSDKEVQWWKKCVPPCVWVTVGYEELRCYVKVSEGVMCGVMCRVSMVGTEDEECHFTVCVHV